MPTPPQVQGHPRSPLPKPREAPQPPPPSAGGTPYKGGIRGGSGRCPPPLRRRPPGRGVQPPQPTHAANVPVAQDRHGRAPIAVPRPPPRNPPPGAGLKAGLGGLKGTRAWMRLGKRGLSPHSPYSGVGLRGSSVCIEVVCDTPQAPWGTPLSWGVVGFFLCIPSPQAAWGYPPSLGSTAPPVCVGALLCWEARTPPLATPPRLDTCSPPLS